MFFFFNDTATTEIYTLSLHDALPISSNISGGTIDTAKIAKLVGHEGEQNGQVYKITIGRDDINLKEMGAPIRSEEHTSELQSQSNLVCRLLLEKKKTQHNTLLACPKT